MANSSLVLFSIFIELMQPSREGMRVSTLFCAQNAKKEKARLLLLFSVLGQAKHRSNDTEGTKGMGKRAEKVGLLLYLLSCH